MLLTKEGVKLDVMCVKGRVDIFLVWVLELFFFYIMIEGYLFFVV